VPTARFWNNHHQVHVHSKLEKKRESQIMKGPKQNNQYQIRSPMPEGGEP
jgi:hypothetical protein